MSTFKCKQCAKEKTRVFSHLNKQGRSLYKDENGRTWTGKLCPDCNVKRIIEIEKGSSTKEAETFNLKCLICKKEYVSDNPYRLFCSPEHAEQHKQEMTKKYGL